MKDLSSLQLIAFDVDGTLAETDDYYVDKLTVSFQKILPFIKPEIIKKIVRPVVMAGETALHGCYRLLDVVGLDKQISKAHSRVSVKQDYVYDAVSGMEKTIELLSSRYIIGIITSGGRKSTDSFLEKFGLEKYIKIVISSEDCKFIKPHPAPMLKIAEETGVAIENCMLVGDTIFDILCAKRAGAISAAVKSGFDSEPFLDRYKADLMLDTVNDLPDILKLR